MNLESVSRGRGVGRPRIEFTEQQLLELKRRYEAGESLMSLAIDYGLGCNWSVSMRLREMGVRIRRPWEARVSRGSMRER